MSANEIEEKIIRDEIVTKKIEREEMVETDEYKRYKKQGEVLFNGIENNLGKIYIKNFGNNKSSHPIKINNKSCANIIKKGDLKTEFRNFIITAVYNEIVSSSNIIEDEDNEKYDKLIEEKKNYVIISTKYKSLGFEEKKRHQVTVPKKAFQNIFKKMGESMEEILDYMEIIIIELTIENFEKELVTYKINRYTQLIKLHNLYYVKVPKNKGENLKNVKLDQTYIKNGLTFMTNFSLDKIMSMSGRGKEENINFLNIEGKNKDIEIFEKDNNEYINNLIENAENMEIYKRFKNQEPKILENWNKIINIPNPRFKKISNDIQETDLDNLSNKLSEIIKKIKNKKDEIKKNISDNKNHFIEIEDNDGDRKSVV